MADIRPNPIHFQRTCKWASERCCWSPGRYQALDWAAHVVSYLGFPILDRKVGYQFNT